MFSVGDKFQNIGRDNNNSAVIITAQTNKGICSALILIGFIMIIVEIYKFKQKLNMRLRVVDNRKKEILNICLTNNSSG